MAEHLESRGLIVVGDGNFGMNVIGTLHSQSQIEQLVGGRTQMGYGLEPPLNRALFAALLRPELDNPYDRHVVRVIIRNVGVGYLELNIAKELFAALALNHLTHATCIAAICGGWHRRPHDRGDDGNFGVRLDIIMPVHFRAPKI